ncbi:hypothetical protein CERZMDRAFT_100041 [Cercospora zeae-maydis SCOH1-5]|uniref:Heterokaryon incompatibility domain-containing protein n=1 Tax=Cercospora zeae-maydis SCOH1-5 TaxID=717836 RepID=A0A6A6F9C9_9PEZI|nr:hypothetical protein CERZMDRAFT_100041 [Cercospora zeae-maydis SCOH1-5]
MPAQNFSPDTASKASMQSSSEPAEKKIIESTGRTSICARICTQHLCRLRLMLQFKQGCRSWVNIIYQNQNGTEELNAQIKVIRSIYQRAGDILVWLDEGSAQLSKAVDVVQDFGKSHCTEYEEAYSDVDPGVAIVRRERVTLSVKVAMDVILSWTRSLEPRQVFLDDDADLLNAFPFAQILASSVDNSRVHDGYSRHGVGPWRQSD